MLALLAAAVLVLGAPEHLLDFDEGSAGTAEAVVHGHARTLIDHAAPGHACAAHCAAHVVGEATAAVALDPPALARAAWPRPGRTGGRSIPPPLPEPPPKA